jgi:hypothetical protein
MYETARERTGWLEGVGTRSPSHRLATEKDDVDAVHLYQSRR